MVNSLIAMTACIMVQLLVNYVVDALVDTCSRQLRPNMLSHKDTAAPDKNSDQLQTFRCSFKIAAAELDDPVIELHETPASPTKILLTAVLASGSSEAYHVLLEAKDLHVVRENVSVTSIAQIGDHIGITGR
jgi:hypothetical protein